MKNLQAVVGFFLFFISTMVVAKDRIVDCSILSMPSGKYEYKGECKFMAHAEGSFTLMSPKGNERFYGSIGLVTVYLTSKNVAEVSGLVIDEPSGGHNSRWGQAKRSKTDRACWNGVDFRICAWGKQ